MEHFHPLLQPPAPGGAQGLAFLRFSPPLLDLRPCQGTYFRPCGPHMYLTLRDPQTEIGAFEISSMHVCKGILATWPPLTPGLPVIPWSLWSGHTARKQKSQQTPHSGGLFLQLCTHSSSCPFSLRNTKDWTPTSQLTLT